MEIIKYHEKYKQQVIDLILHIQNDEANLHLQIEDQPDLLMFRPIITKMAGVFGLPLKTVKLLVH